MARTRTRSVQEPPCWAALVCELEFRALSIWDVYKYLRGHVWASGHVKVKRNDAISWIAAGCCPRDCLPWEGCGSW